MLADSLYGTSSEFIEALESLIGATYIVQVSGIRWAIEQCFEETKSELGMDHYEVRKYAGWHHHMLASILAHFFCGILNYDWEKNTIYYYIAA